MNACKHLVGSIVAPVLLAFIPIGIAQAQVKVTAATPASTYQGTVSLDVVVNGSGFDNTSNAQFVVTGTTNPGGITVKKTVFHNAKEIVATIDVADTAVVRQLRRRRDARQRPQGQGHDVVLGAG